MVDFEVIIDVEAKEFLDHLPEKSHNIIKAKLSILKTDPFPGIGGDKELLNSPKHKEVYRLHISDLIPPFIALKGKPW